jgi:transposase
LSGRRCGAEAGNQVFHRRRGRAERLLFGEEVPGSGPLFWIPGASGHGGYPRQPGDGPADRGPGLADRLPAAALRHELNPVELVWSQLKRSLANLAERNLAQLTALVKTRLKRMQHRPALLDGFLASTRLDLTPF